MTEDECDLLKLDYKTTIAFLDKADGWLFQIRNWAAVSSSAVVAYSVSKDNLLVLGLAPFLVMGFWFFELIYKSFHEDCIGKSYQLEEILRDCVRPGSEMPGDYEFGIGHAIEPVRVRRLLEIVRNPKRWHNNVAYLGLLVMCLGVFVYLRWFTC